MSETHLAGRFTRDVDGLLSQEGRLEPEPISGEYREILELAGTLAKGVRVLSDYVRDVLNLEGVSIEEGSGISRKNRLSAMDMLAVLRRFEGYRSLLVSKGTISYKTGSLRGVRTRAGYVEGSGGDLYYFVVFLNGSGADIDYIVDCVKKSVNHG